jgi:DNA helicase II / ATP-dependent DNA helicase PcrA
MADVTLDPSQRAAVELPAGRALLVLGEAGHGKTTVAVHRLAHLWRVARAEKRTLRAAVVVPNEGLARLVQSLLTRLGVDVDARTYDRWARRQARRAFGDLPRRECELTPPAVARVKRDPALRGAIEGVARRPPAHIDDDPDAPPVRTRARAVRADLQQLFGDRGVLEAVVDASCGRLAPRLAGEVLEHTRVQFSLTAEREFSHVTDRKRLIAVDRRRLDDGTATADAGTVDVEDYAVLFEIDRLRAARAGAPPTAPRAYDALLLDEAQELAPIELALLGRSLAPNGSLIVAGDAGQQTDPTTTFAGWDAAMSALGRDEHARATLDVGYRCPPEVAAMARAILGLEPPLDMPRASFDDERACDARLADELRALARRDPRASVAVVCRTPMRARRFADALRAAELPVRLVYGGAFLPRGPTQVTVVEETKGLEFDTVIVPDATAADYPDTPASRRALYVAVTRARHEVLLTHSGPPSPLVTARAGG